MERTYHSPLPSKMVSLIGKNFIIDNLFNNFKRYSEFKTIKNDYISDINKKVNFIIDCSFNEQSQNDVLQYSIENNIEKVIIINHWKKQIEKIDNLIVIQLIAPDIYGQEHNSFNRSGYGNSNDPPINYCNFICESIRRIQDAKRNFIPNIYIDYGEELIKYMFIENLYEPIQYIINNIEETSEYEVYDEQKNAGSILNIIKDIMEYKGEITFINTKSYYTNHSLTKLPYQHNYKLLSLNVLSIYRYLSYNNERFMNDIIF